MEMAWDRSVWLFHLFVIIGLKLICRSSPSNLFTVIPWFIIPNKAPAGVWIWHEIRPLFWCSIIAAISWFITLLLGLQSSKPLASAWFTGVQQGLSDQSISQTGSILIVMGSEQSGFTLTTPTRSLNIQLSPSSSSWSSSSPSFAIKRRAFHSNCNKLFKLPKIEQISSAQNKINILILRSFALLREKLCSWIPFRFFTLRQILNLMIDNNLIRSASLYLMMFHLASVLRRSSTFIASKIMPDQGAWQPDNETPYWIWFFWSIWTFFHSI